MARDDEFARWYHAHHDRIRTLCARILRDPIAAEDMAQETLLRAWVRRDQMREEDLGAWLSVVARNLCLSAIRKDGRLVVTDELPERVDHSADPAVEVGRRESRRNVRRALGKLGDRNRRVIDLREVREANYEEIGSELGVSAEGARAIAFRARRVLREHLAAVGEGFSGVLVGIRIRVRTAAVRSRSWMTSEPAMTPLLQASLAIVITTGVMFASAAAPGVARPTNTSKGTESVSAFRNAAPTQPLATVVYAPPMNRKENSPIPGSPIKPKVSTGNYPCDTYPAAGYTSDLPGESGDTWGDVWVQNEHPTKFGQWFIPKTQKAADLVVPGECPQ